MKEFTVTIDRTVKQLRIVTIKAESKEQAYESATDIAVENEGWDGKEYDTNYNINIEEVPNNDYEHAYEVCPHCDQEVMLDPELKVQTCPNCGRRIVTCSMCRAKDAPGLFCATCCLCYQAGKENEELQMKTRINDPEHQFSEVKCDFFDDVTGCWCVDAWGKYEDDGEVVAKINPDTLEVTYNHPDFAKDKLVKETVAWRMKEILKDKSDTLARDLQ